MPAAGSHNTEFQTTWPTAQLKHGGIKLLNKSSFSLNPASQGEEVEEGEESVAEDELQPQQQPRCHTGREISQPRSSCNAKFITCVVY